MPAVSEVVFVPGEDNRVCQAASPRPFSANEDGVFCDLAPTSTINGLEEDMDANDSSSQAVDGNGRNSDPMRRSE